MPVRKASSLGATSYAYDEAGHLLGEYDDAGNAVQETVWPDDLPVATVRNGAVNYVHADHLGTPRYVTDAANGTLRWTWDSDPYGVAAPNENPSGTGQFVYNLRFAGQVFDAETGLHQNWHREYRPVLGRYVESDPIGLHAGLATFTYVDSNPIVFTDPAGYSKFDKWWGLPKDFQRWFHRKMKKSGDPDIPDRETAESLYKEWKDSGCPGSDAKYKKQRGAGDLEFLIDLLMPCCLCHLS